LLADIGGTNARFALADEAVGVLKECLTVSVSDHATFTSALEFYLTKIAALGEWEQFPVDVCLAVACPTDQDNATFTNSSWCIDRRGLAELLNTPNLKLINDFEAIGHAVPHLQQGDWQQIGTGKARPDSAIAVLGPGTGLGVCAVVPGVPAPRVLAGEGGHVDFAPVGDTEIQILRLLLTRNKRVSLERLLSGAGIENIYWALSQIHDAEHRQSSPAAISAAAVAGDDEIAVETLKVFFRVLGSAAGNLALNYGAKGGVYIAGGIAPRLIDFLRESEFRARFLAKGRFQDYLSQVPTRVVTRDSPGLLGALKFLQHRNKL